MASQTEIMQSTQTRSTRAIDPLPILAAFRWVGRGLDDFRQAPGLSLLCGAAFALPAAGVYLLAWDIPWFTTGYLTGLTAVGIATAFVGFLVIFPVLGYATWHSYRELMPAQEGDQ